MALQQQERRVLNDAIEMAYLETSELASMIDAYFHTGEGANFILFKSFYLKANFLYRITSNQDEMINNAKTEITQMRAWLDSDPPKNNKDIDAALKEGVLAFNKYDIALSQTGLITLPHKGK